MRSDARKRDDELDEFEYTLTRRALRQIKAEAWDEGFTRGFYDVLAVSGCHDASESSATNPYGDS